MPGMGLAGMGGAAGAGDALATLFDQRLRAAAEQRAQQQQQIQQQEFQQNQARLDAAMRISAQEKADLLTQKLKEDNEKNAVRLNTELSGLPQDTEISAGTRQGMVQGGVVPERFQPTPITPQAPPASLAAPDQPPPGPMPGTVANSPQPGRVTFQRIPTPKEAAQQKLLALFPIGSKERVAAEYNIGTGGDNLPAGVLPKAPGPGQIHDTPQGLQRISEDNTSTPVLGPDGKPLQGYHPPKADPESSLVKVEHQDENGRTVIEYLPKSEVRGKTYKKGASGATETRLASAEAVTQTGNDIIAKLGEPAYAKTLGPALGRYSNLRDFIGNPPPEFSELAGLIESYALANMGVHGMRSAQGAEQIKRLLEGHHTPESLAASVKGLNGFAAHFLENEGRGVKTTPGATTSAAPTAPAGWKYVAKPGGGWTAVEDKP